MGVGKGHGEGSKHTQFKRSLESRPIAFYQRGPRKGQPKICKLCPNFVRVSTRKDLLCATHQRIHRRKHTKRVAAAQFRKRAAFVLGITRPPAKPLSAYKARAQRPDYQGLFGHIPDSYQEIAHRELQQLLADNKKPLTSAVYAGLVACATAMAKFGGRKQWAATMRQKRLNIGYYRKKLLADPQGLNPTS